MSKSPYLASLYEDMACALWWYRSIYDRPSNWTSGGQINDEQALEDSIQAFLTCYRRVQKCLKESGHKFKCTEMERNGKWLLENSPT